VPITDNLVSFWKLDEASGNRADAHGSDTLIDHNTVGSASGKLNSCADFEAGSQEALYVVNNARMQTGDIDYWFSLWVNFETLDGNDRIILGKDDLSSNREHVLYCSSASGGTVGWAVFNGGSTLAGIVTATGFSTGTWYKLDVWHDATNNQVGIAVNNGTPTTASTSGAAGANTQDFRVGTEGTLASTRFFDGKLDELGFWKRVPTSGDRTTMYGGGTPPAYPFSTSYTLTAAAGSYSLTGSAAGVRAARKLVAAAGSFALAGGATGLEKGFEVAADAGSYSLAGGAATLRVTRRVPADAGSYALTGSAAGLKAGRKLAGDAGSYSLTGNTATLDYSGSGSKTLSADAGSYSLTGSAAALRAGRRVTAAAGGYRLAPYGVGSDGAAYPLDGSTLDQSGNGRNLSAATTYGTGRLGQGLATGSPSVNPWTGFTGVPLSVQCWVYHASGGSTQVRWNTLATQIFHLATVSTGEVQIRQGSSTTATGVTLADATHSHVVLTVDGSNNGALYVNNASAWTGTVTPPTAFGRFNLSASGGSVLDQVELYGRMLSADERALSYNNGSGLNQTARLAYGRGFVAAAGAYALSGSAAGLTAGRRVTGDVGSYSLAGNAAGLAVGRKVAAAFGSYLLTGDPAALRRAGRLVAAAGSYALSGAAATLAYTPLFVPTPPLVDLVLDFLHERGLTLDYPHVRNATLEVHR